MKSSYSLISQMQLLACLLLLVAVPARAQSGESLNRGSVTSQQR